MRMPYQMLGDSIYVILTVLCHIVYILKVSYHIKGKILILQAEKNSRNKTKKYTN